MTGAHASTCARVGKESLCPKPGTSTGIAWEDESVRQGRLLIVLTTATSSVFLTNQDKLGRTRKTQRGYEERTDLQTNTETLLITSFFSLRAVTDRPFNHP